MTAERLVLPIGQDHGPSGTSGAREVRRGATVHEVAEFEAVVWGLAHGSAAAISSGTPWRRDALITLASAAGVPSADGCVSTLSAAGLLVEVEPGSEEADVFARTHRLVPTMVGLGNTAGDPDRYGIGVVGRPALEVDFATYDLWQWSAMEDSMWDTCESAADVAHRAGDRSRQHLDTEKLCTGLLRALHPMLTVRAAYLDIAFRLSVDGMDVAGMDVA